MLQYPHFYPPGDGDGCGRAQCAQIRQRLREGARDAGRVTAGVQQRAVLRRPGVRERTGRNTVLRQSPGRRR